MEITEVKVFPIGEEKLKAFVSVVFDRCFMVNDIKIIQGRDGLFISMPSRKKKNGEFKDVAHPLNNDTRRLIENEILGEYERVLAERGASPSPSSSRRPHRRPPTSRSDGSGGRSRSERAVPVTGGGPGGPPPEPPASPLPAPRAAAAGESEAAAESATAAASERPGGDAESSEEKPSLEEVQELHLRDSFWSVS